MSKQVLEILSEENPFRKVIENTIELVESLGQKKYKSQVRTLCVDALKQENETLSDIEANLLYYLIGSEFTNIGEIQMKVYSELNVEIMDVVAGLESLINKVGWVCVQDFDIKTSVKVHRVTPEVVDSKDGRKKNKPRSRKWVEVGSDETTKEKFLVSDSKSQYKIGNILTCSQQKEYEYQGRIIANQKSPGVSGRKTSIEPDKSLRRFGHHVLRKGEYCFSISEAELNHFKPKKTE